MGVDPQFLGGLNFTPDGMRAIAMLRSPRSSLVGALVITLVFAPLAGAQVERAASASWVEETLKSMSLDEKVGQLIVPAMVGMFTPQSSEGFQKIRRDIAEFHVGGYHLLGDVNILHDPVGVALLINRMQEMARVPLLITADLEGGAGLRYRGATRLPRAMAIGATFDQEMAYEAGRITASEARAIGINVNFYPVADVNNNPRNPIINIRSFGGDPELVSSMVRAYIAGLQEWGVLATAKHFPGHGDTSVDSHLELPVIEADRDRLDRIELVPFKEAIKSGVGAVMTAHIALPKVDPSKVPATLSEKVLTDLLRRQMGFQGLIFTDAMDMRGVAAHYPGGEAAVRALKAGADIILYPPDTAEAFNAIKQAVISGQIPEKRIDESVRRILWAKAGLRLDEKRFVDLDQLDRILGNSEHKQTAMRMIEGAITLVRNQKNVLPLKLKPDQKVLFIAVVDRDEGWREGEPGKAFLAGLIKRHRNVTAALASDQTSPAEFELIKKMASLADVIIACGFIRVAAYKGSIDLTEGQLGLLRHLSRLDKPFAFVLFGSPYLISFVPELPTYVLAYEYYPDAEDAALRALLGEIEFKGRLPIELAGFYGIGHSASSR